MTDETAKEFLGDNPEVKEPVVPKSDEGNTYNEFLQAIKSKEGTQKYKTVADALIGASHQEMHIARLEEENKNLRGVSEKVAMLEELVTRLGVEKQGDSPVVLKPEVTEDAIVSVMERREAMNREKANRQAVLDTLESKFGDKVDEVLAAKAKDLGVSVKELGALAARSPKLVLGYFASEVRGTPSVKGSVNTEGLVPVEDELKAPANLLWGAPTKDVTAFFKQIKQQVLKENDLI